MKMTILNITFLGYLTIIQDYVLKGEPIPPNLLEEAEDCGRLAQVPEEQLNVLKVFGHHGATIH